MPSLRTTLDCTDCPKISCWLQMSWALIQYKDYVIRRRKSIVGIKVRKVRGFLHIYIEYICICSEYVMNDNDI